MTTNITAKENEVKTSNDLRHTVTRSIGDKKIIVKIRLNDECKNGHQDFAITADIYEKARNGRHVRSCGGCCHDEILKYFPQFKIFIDLHLSDYLGAPTYAVANGFYLLKNSDKQTVLNYLRINDDLYNKLYLAEDKEYFKYLLYSLGIVEQWSEEARQGIKYLEQLTKTEFINDSKRSQIEPLSEEEKKDIETRLKEGYYNIDAINLRNEEARQTKKNELILDLQTKFLNEKTKLKKELTVKMFLLKNDFSIDNFIYYTHKNEGVFNWQSWGTKFSEEDFNRLLSLDFSELPKDIAFKLGEK